MTPTEIGLLLVGTSFMCVCCFAAGLMTGWRFGRESQGKPPFSFDLLPPAETKVNFVEDDDPWARALNGKEII